MDRWIVACAAGTLLARVGLAFYTCGSVRAKNAGGSLLRHVADLCLAALAFWAVGIALLGPGDSAAPFQPKFLLGLRGGTTGAAPSVLLMLTAVLLATGIVVGCLSERTRFWPSLVPSLALAGILVPSLARCCAAGHWLGRLGFHDFAGASFVHMAAGIFAGVGAVAVGPRQGKYNRDGSSNVIPGHSLPLTCGGVLLVFIAWFPYVLGFGAMAGADAGVVAMNTLLAVAAAGAASLGMAHVRYRKPDIYLTFGGVLGGLVAASAGADVMSQLAAVATGAVAGVLVPLLLMEEDLVWRIDDPTGALVIHGVGGSTGNATVAGGAGADLFGFFSGSGGGTITVTDFSAADRIGLYGFAAGAQAAALAGATVAAGSTTVTLADSTRVVLTGYTSLTASQFV